MPQATALLLPVIVVLVCAFIRALTDEFDIPSLAFQLHMYGVMYLLAVLVVVRQSEIFEHVMIMFYSSCVTVAVTAICAAGCSERLNTRLSVSLYDRVALGFSIFFFTLGFVMFIVFS